MVLPHHRLLSYAVQPVVAIFLAIALLAIPALGSAQCFAADEPVSQDDADFTVREITQKLFQAAPGVPVDFSNHDLTYLDLSGLNFKGARLAHSDLYGVDFTRTNLSRTDLYKTRLDRAVLIKTDLRFSNLSGATLLRPTVYSDISENLSDAPDFSGARLIGTRIQADLSGARFRGADLTKSDLSPYEKRPGEGTFVTHSYNTFASCDFSGAILRNANLHRANFTFSLFNGADLKGANAAEVNFTKADLRGADLTSTDITGANFDGANLAGIKGLALAHGVREARNLDKAFSVPEDVKRLLK